jgi:hypothetical protein
MITNAFLAEEDADVEPDEENERGELDGLEARPCAA